MLYHSPLFDYIRDYFKNSHESDTVFLFVPYIKTNILANLLNKIQNKIVVVTTWNPSDILSGSSEIELYPFCKEHKISLYVNEKLHLKFYSVGLCSAILATGNISHRGMMIDGNYEAAVMLDSLAVGDRLFFENILRDGRLVNDAMYAEIKEWIKHQTFDPVAPIRLKDITSDTTSDDFLISALPMTGSVDNLISGYKKITDGIMPSNDPEIASCIFHDLANYDMTSNLSENEFLQELSAKFFAHPFIQKIDGFIAPETYFGRIKEWVQENCTDVPVPSRRDLTGNIQVLLEWFVRLGNDKYVIDVPRRRSQRIRKIDNNAIN